MITKNLEKIITGAALAVAASALLPIAKMTLRPLAMSGMEGVVALVNRTKALMQIAREEVEDIIAEAQYERLKKQINKEIAMFDTEDESLSH
ncbi:DUF5132 domain-containing protein [Brevibacillus sp. SYP-B805]|uniref:DUF5132 domain-containing protein n=1 Tax=Brevibacillus sp. SYP-B805 TaxID=1578199 RepID=UPI0013EBCBEF|nr:DUF5132 domain-containing protein [Brevibacillus sp. SYP-B805]NGQ95784.1 DUF5132 domain-containing protein [Brevibacillus sp. SYP-B805]